MKFIILILALLCSISGFSQNYKGRVIDEWGRNLPNVKVGVNGKSFESNQNGEFQFSLKNEKISNVVAEKKPFQLGKWEIDGDVLFLVMSSPLKLIGGNVSTIMLQPVPHVKVEIYGLKESFPAYTNKEGDFTLRVPYYYSVTATTRFLVDGYEITNNDYAFSEKDLFLRITRTEGQKLLVRQEPQVPLMVRTETKKLFTKGLKLNLYGKDYTVENQNLLKVFKLPNDYRVEIADTNEKDGFIYANFYDENQKDTSATKGKVLFSDDLQIPINPKAAVAEIMRSDNKGTRLANEVLRISKLINSTKLDSIKRVHLQIYLEHLEDALYSSDTAYQNSRERTQSLLERVKRAVMQKDSVEKVGSENYEKIKKEKDDLEKRSRRNILISAGVVLFLVGLTYMSIRVAQNIRRQRNELSRVNRKLEIMTDDLTEKINFIEHQKEEINKQALSLQHLNQKLSENNKKVTDSIRYALTIQTSVLPTHETLVTLFRDCFVIYRPKDIVSGDFYWLAYVPQKEKEMIFLAVIDCTGHGVSGAFMSMIGNTLLNEVINKKKIYRTAQVLEELDRGIREILKQDETSNDDGMDVCLCKFIQSWEETKIIFTGAKRPLFYFKEADNSIEIIKGDPRSLGGGKSNKKKRDFTEHKISLKAGDVLYFCSDGFTDQSNEENQKFGTNRLLELIQDIAHYPMSEQQQILEKALNEHQGNAEQRDDISVIGIKI